MRRYEFILDLQVVLGYSFGKEDNFKAVLMTTAGRKARYCTVIRMKAFHTSSLEMKAYLNDRVRAICPSLPQSTTKFV